MYAITNRHLCKDSTEEGYLRQIERICAAAPDGIVLREKDLSEEEYAILAAKVKVLCDERNVKLYIHNFPDVAKKLGIRRLHMPLAALKEMHNKSEAADSDCNGKVMSGESDRESEGNYFDELGSSVHSKEELELAIDAGVTYVFLGNIYETDCKPGLHGKGTVFIREMIEYSKTLTDRKLGFYAIGGISEDNIEEVLQAGADGACQMSAFMRK